MLLDERAVLLRDGSITSELLAHDPTAFIGMLTPKSEETAQALLKAGVELSSVDRICSQCNAQAYRQMLAEGQAQAWKGGREINNKLHAR
jgi:hypothetical protein